MISGVAWSVVFGEYATNNIFVELDAKGISDLLGDSHATKALCSAKIRAVVIQGAKGCSLRPGLA
jgi:hypothetical protein